MNGQDQLPRPKLPVHSEGELTSQEELGGLLHELTEEQLRAMVGAGLGGMAHRRQVERLEATRKNKWLYGLSGQGHSTPEEREIIVNMRTLAADIRDKAAADDGESLTEIVARRRAREIRRQR